MRRKKIWLVGLLAICAAGSAWWLRTGDLPSSDLLVSEASRALRRGDYAEARRLGEMLIDRGDARTAGSFLLAKACSNDEDPTAAIRYFEQVPDDDPQYGLAARISGGELLLFRAHKLSAATECFHRALRIDPHHVQVHERLSYIYGVAGLHQRGVPHRMALLCQDKFGPVHVMLLALGPNHEEDKAAIRRCHATVPEDPLAQSGMAWLALREGRDDEAADLLRRLLAQRPDWPETQASYGALLLARDPPDSDAVRAWEALLPEAAARYPEVWFVRGMLARRRQTFPVAVRCFAEAVRAEPNHQAANFQLAKTLQELGEAEKAAPFLKRANLLEDLVSAVKMWQISPTRKEPLEQAARLTTELGLLWEARGWRRGLYLPEIAEPQRPPTLLKSDSDITLETILDAYRAARQAEPLNLFTWDIAEYPLPVPVAASGNPPAGPRGSEPSGDLAAGRGIRFEDEASKAGLHFVYRNGSHPETAGEHMFEQTGGGVGVLDYDGDGWPDLCFTNGCDWPPPSASQALRSANHRDRLYRNVEGTRFEDVTDAANLIEDRFGQGIAVGDLDNDGFPDVYVSNIGGNRLFRNNGDGTFSEVADAVGVAGSEWSTSAAIADVNGDSQPDLYVVNYIEGKGMFDRPCLLPDGRVRLCTPYEFDATHDRLYENQGDGSFRDVSEQAGILVPEGKGLGIVAADFDGSGQVGLFVANDTVPNFFFRNRTKEPGGTPEFEEQGFVSGLAVDSEGRSQACMGVAGGDSNGDGLLDLFVTNFHQEANVLYLQQSGLLFSDETRAARLYEPGYAQLGFGTQFLDADLDGHLDLIVTNGHVGDLSHRGVPYQMPTQVFHNDGLGRFDEVPADDLGDFFQRKHLGRGLARLDWNRDGLDDAAVSHLEEPAALLTNRTGSPGRFLSLRLRGTQSARDAVGATVTVTSGGRARKGHLTAGDGYQASNEKRVTFGLGADAGPVDVEIHWPSGLRQTFPKIAADAEILIVEGRPTPVVLVPAR